MHCNRAVYDMSCYHRTGMFSGIFEQTYTWLHRLLLPILTEQQVSRATIHAIQDGYEVDTCCCVSVSPTPTLPFECVPAVCDGALACVVFACVRVPSAQFRDGSPVTHYGRVQWYDHVQRERCGVVHGQGAVTSPLSGLPPLRMESNHASLIIACICIALSGVAAHVNEPPEPSSNITVCYPSRSNNTAFATINMICNMTELIKVSQAVPCTVNFMPIAEAEASQVRPCSHSPGCESYLRCDYAFQEWIILFDGEKAAQPVQKGSSIDSSIVWFANLPVETAERFGTQIAFSSNAFTSGNVLAYVGCGLSAAVKYQRLDGANLRRVASARKQVSILAGPAIQSLGNTTALIVWRLDAGGGQGSDSNQCTVRVGRCATRNPLRFAHYFHSYVLCTGPLHLTVVQSSNRTVSQ